jgi:hypothetical protein
MAARVRRAWIVLVVAVAGIGIVVVNTLRVLMKPTARASGRFRVGFRCGGRGEKRVKNEGIGAKEDRGDATKK